MGYQIQPVISTVSDTILNVDLKDKFAGVFVPQRETIKAAKVNLKTLLLTRKGERYHQPTFGCNLLYEIFEPISDFTKDRINTYINEAVSYWLPYITLDTVEIKTMLDDPDLLHNIQIDIEFSVNDFAIDKITIFSNEDGTLIIT